MFKKIIGAVIGAKLAGNSPKADSAAGAAGGALAATALPFVITRISIPALLAVGVGGYLFKRHHEKSAAEKGTRTKASA